MYEIPLNQQIDKSNLIVEGKVISKKSFWDEGYKKIYTLNMVEVHKVFKGKTNPVIQVITLGGKVGDIGLTVSHHLELSENEIGVFLLNSSNQILLDDSSDKSKYKMYSGKQGFYKYDLIFNKASNVFKVYNDIENNFYRHIETVTKKNYTEISKRVLTDKNRTNKSSLLPFVLGFSPSTITAGTASVLTINGLSFGSTKGKVQFNNADDGGATFIDALDSDITSWTNTSITVKVPDNAGTGQIKVIASDNSFGSSGAVLNIPYAVLNRNGIMQQHYNTNTSGGYTWKMSAEFDSFNGGIAKESFLRALNSWVCSTGVNWVLSSPSIVANNFARDGINVITFDPTTDELDVGVLGATLNWTTSCGTAVIIDEIDMVFDGEQNWEYGPANAVVGKFDFETVAVHELGHAHALGHVIVPGAIMHFAISSGTTNRVLGINDENGGDFIHNISINTPQCSTAPMTSISCPSLGTNEETLNDAVSLFPNPTKGIFHIKRNSFVNLDKAFIYDISGRLISKHDLSNSSNSNTINLLGMSKGIYFINIFSNNIVTTRKIVLE